VALAAAVGIKFLPAILLPFYLAAGRVSIALRAVVIGVIGLLVTLPLVWQPMLDYIALIPRYAETAWVRVIVQRDEPALLATIFWSDAFPLILALVAISLGLLGRSARPAERGRRVRGGGSAASASVTTRSESGSRLTPSR